MLSYDLAMASQSFFECHCMYTSSIKAKVRTTYFLKSLVNF